LSLRGLAGRLRGWARWLVRHYDAVILVKPIVGTVKPLPPGLTLEEYDRDHPDVLAINLALGRHFPEERLRTRFERGLRFFALRKGDRVVATTWIIGPGERFIDEAGVGLIVESDALSQRDVFVAPAERGHGLYALMMDAVVARSPGLRKLWALVEGWNRTSLRAHRRYGYEPAYRVEVLHLAGRLMVRLRSPDREALGTVFGGRRRFVLTGQRYRRFAAERVT